MCRIAPATKSEHLEIDVAEVGTNLDVLTERGRHASTDCEQTWALRPAAANTQLRSCYL